jgi:hypothetical protein
LIGVPLPIGGHPELRVTGKPEADHTNVKEAGDTLDSGVPPPEIVVIQGPRCCRRRKKIDPLDPLPRAFREARAAIGDLAVRVVDCLLYGTVKAAGAVCGLALDPKERKRECDARLWFCEEVDA